VLPERSVCRTRADTRVASQTRNGEISTEPLGAGVVWDQRGYVVVTFHSLSRALAPDATAASAAPQPPAAPAATAASAAAAGVRTLRVAVIDASDGTLKTFGATVAGVSPAHDLAVLLLADAPPEALSPVPLGSDADVRVGQSAFAVGLSALSYGIISGLRRPLPSPTGQLVPGGALQTDASVDASNSGGALLDSSGRLMGICVAPLAAATRAGTTPPRPASSLGFAIPVDTVRAVVPQLIAFGSVDASI
jgi:S1-C subfamily serine protease